ncbi:MAG: SGNH/GDSL hydrolase family protein [Spirochaetes bacterium]|nr:SGNH/GDSL hydrolase family protein [Spirochaetota bacterium]
MKTIILPFLASIALIYGGEGVPALPKYNHDTNMVEELRVRDGLPNIFAKLKAGGKCNIAYLGGSITAAGGSEEKGGGWRGKSLTWFKTQFPTAEVTEINAAIGGTGSDYGAFRVYNHALRFDPDIVFVEFRVNGGGAVPLASIEGIVRQIWKKNTKTDICFVYTLSEPMKATIGAGSNTSFGAIIEQVANYYGIPSVDYGPEVMRLEKEGTLIFRGKAPAPEGKILFSTDGVHPLVEEGHNVYKAVITRSLTSMKETGTAGAHSIPAPIDPKNWENAKMIPFTDVELSKGWYSADMASDRVAASFKRIMPVVIKSGENNAAITVKFTGTVIGINDIVGPDTGQLLVSIDGGEPARRIRFDHYCTYHRPQFFFMPELASGPHTVTFTIDASPIDKAAIFKQRGQKFDSPARFSEQNLYIGSVMIIGDVDPSVAGKGTLPPQAPKQKIDFDFENRNIGDQPVFFTVSEEGTGTIRVTDAKAAGGKKSILFTDAEGIKSFNPHMYTSLSQTTGKWKLAFDILNDSEKPAAVYVELRDNTVNPFIQGPSLSFGQNGTVLANSQEAGKLALGEWAHVEIVFDFAGAKTYDCTITQGGKNIVTTKQAFSDKFKTLTWMGFVSDTRAQSYFYLDNVKFDEVK